MKMEMDFTYYRSTPELAVQTEAAYEPIREERQRILSKLLADTGAIGYTVMSNWGKPSGIRCVIVPEGHELLSDKAIKQYGPVEGVKGIAIRGKNNQKAGIALNSLIVDASRKLQDAPTFQEWVPIHFDCMRACLGRPSVGQRGTPMIETLAGMSQQTVDGQKVILLQVPLKNSHDTEEAFVPPDGFEKITYGQFYDLATAG